MSTTGGQAISMMKKENKNRNTSKTIIKPDKLERKENYFNDVTLQFLEEKCDDDVIFDKLLVLSFNNQHLRTLGDLSKLVSNLQICNLSGNYLTDISSMMSCCNLQKLDVHGNQITNLPDQTLWSNMHHLEFLYLHDNAIASFEVVNNISGCPKLLALTLYDTPLSLWITYRHTVINSLHTLKALDWFVIADEEIIDDLNQSSRFAAFQKELKIDLCPPQTKLHSAATEFKLIKNLKKRINKIISHHCSVVIIQKCIRGYLSRRRSATSVINDEANHLELTDSLKLTNSTTHCELLPHEEVKHQTEDGQKLLRPKLELKSVLIPSSKNIQSSSSSTSYGIYNQEYSKPTASIYDDSYDCYRNIVETVNQEKEKNGTILQNKRNIKSKNKAKNKAKNFKWETLEGKPGEYFAFNFIGEDIPISSLHLQGYSKPIHEVYAFTNIMLENQLVSSAIRSAHNHYHKISTMPKPESIEIPVDLFLSQRKQIRKENLYKRLFRHISKSCLFSVQQAYEDQWLAVKNKNRLDEVCQRKMEEQVRKQRLEEIEHEKYYHRLMKKEQEKIQLNEEMERKYLENKKHLKVLQTKRFDSSKITSERVAERNFVKDFSSQQLSLSRALIRHNQLKLSSKTHQAKTYLVKSMHLSEQQQFKRIRDYIVYHQKRNQAENYIVKHELKTSQHLIKLNKLEESKGRVEHAKASHLKDRVVMYPLPIVSLNKLSKLKNKKTDDSQHLAMKHTKLLLQNNNERTLHKNQK